MVQPKIDTLNKPPRDVAIVIFHKHDAIFNTGLATKFINLFDQGLSTFIPRMRFTGENELNRPGRVVEQFFQAFLVAEK